MNDVTAEFVKLNKSMGSKRVSAIHFSELVLQCKVSLNIDPNGVTYDVNRKTIARRMSRGSTVVHGKGPRSPAQHIEYALINKGRKFSCNGEDWCTHNNFLNMYKCIYDEMLLPDVAAKIGVPVYMDRDGSVVSTEKGFGRKCTHKLVHSDIVFDETGGNTCMKHDGHVAGMRYVHRQGATAKMSDNYFTLLTVPSLTDEAAMCVVIFVGGWGV